MHKLKKASLIILILFYFAAGTNHFKDPLSYIKIIPGWLALPSIINLAAGFFELLFAALLIFKRTRPFAAWGIIFMLIAFLPVHISMIGDAPLQLGSITVTPLIAWIRLVVLQPLLIWWAWWYTDADKKEKLAVH